MCYVGWVAHVQNLVIWMGRPCAKQKEDGPRMRAVEEETAPFCFVSLSFMTCLRHDYMYMFC